MTNWFFNFQSRLAHYFLGEQESMMQDAVSFANRMMMVYICLMSLLILIPLQIGFLFTDEAVLAKQLMGIASIAVLVFSLYYMKRFKTIQPIAMGLMIFSWTTFTINMLLHPEAMINGLHIAINLLFIFNVLGIRASLIAFAMHVLVIVVSEWADEFGFSSELIRQIDQTTSERVLTTIIMMVIVLSMMVYFNNTQRKASRKMRLIAKRYKNAKLVAEEMNQLKSIFLANMSHEIRTPLNAILGINELMREEDVHPDIRELLDIQHKSGQRLLGTLEGVLSLTKIEAGQNLKLADLDLRCIAEEVIENHRLDAEKKQVDLGLKKGDEALMVYVDETMLFQVLTNLISNAIKFTNAGGSVEVVLSPLDQRFCKVEVIDTGVGIDREFLKRLFEPFEQESKGRSRRYQGTGLGLSITKKFMEMMDGSVSVRSKKGEGSTFTLHIPTSKQQME